MLPKNTLRKKYGAKYLETRQYHTKSKGAQEAHEAIRPTRIWVLLSAGADAASKRTLRTYLEAHSSKPNGECGS
jgi:DNA topoisomerase IA